VKRKRMEKRRSLVWEKSKSISSISEVKKKLSREPNIFDDMLFEDEDFIFVKENDNWVLHGANVKASINKFSDPDVPSGYELLKMIVFCHTLYITSIELLDLLRKIYVGSKKYPTKRKLIVNLLNCWMSTNNFIFENPDNLKSLKKILAQIEKYDLDSLETILTSWEQSYTTPYSKIKSIELVAPKPVFTKKCKELIYSKFPVDIAELSIVDFNATEIARQLCLIDSDYAHKIQTWEYLTFGKWDEPTECINICNFTTWYNNIVSSVITQVLSGDSIKKRAKIFNKFLNIAEKLIILQNFNSLLAIVHGLCHFTIQGLAETMKLVDRDKFNKIEQIGSPIKNFRILRGHYDSANPPFIPPQALILHDLSLIGHGNDTIISDKNKIINVDKVILLGKIFNRLEKNKEVPYLFCKVDLIQKFLTNLKLIISDTELEDLAKGLE